MFIFLLFKSITTIYFINYLFINILINKILFFYNFMHVVFGVYAAVRVYNMYFKSGVIYNLRKKKYREIYKTAKLTNKSTAIVI